MSRSHYFVVISNPSESLLASARKASHSHAVREAHAKKRRLRVQKYQQKHGFVQSPVHELNQSMPRAVQRVMEMSWGGLLPSLPKRISPQERLLLDHYIKVIVPISSDCCGIFERPGGHEAQIMREWVALAMMDAELLEAAVLLNACRSMMRSELQEPGLASAALMYREHALRSLRRDVEHAPTKVTAVTVARAVALAIDEVASGELGTARQHLHAIDLMVTMSGGLRSVGLSSLLEKLYTKYLEWKWFDDEGFMAKCEPRSNGLLLGYLR